MNSLLQQLLMMPAFRKGIFDNSLVSLPQPDQPSNLLFQLQVLIFLF